MRFQGVHDEKNRISEEAIWQEGTDYKLPFLQVYMPCWRRNVQVRASLGRAVIAGRNVWLPVSSDSCDMVKVRSDEIWTKFMR